MRPVERVGRVTAGLRLLGRLAPDERRMLRLAWWELLVCRLQVLFRCAFRTSDSVTDAAGSRPRSVPVERLLAVFSQAALTSVHGTYCLPRSLALRRFLGRYGADACLRFGTRKTGEGWTGHVWLERDGRVMGDSEEFVKQFVPFHETGVE